MPQSRSHPVFTILFWTLLCFPFSVPAARAADSPPPEPSTDPHAMGQLGRADFTVAPRSKQLRNYPCTMCHQFVPPNPEPRALTVEHPMLEHGNGDIWCSACHDMETPDRLGSGIVEDVAFDDAYVICGRCHAPQLQDWQFGGHSKRVGNWQGERELYGCVHCHDPHAPEIAPREPQPPPPVRAGLEQPRNTGHSATAIWKRFAMEPIEGDREQARDGHSSTPRASSFERLTASGGQDG